MMRLRRASALVTLYGERVPPVDHRVRFWRSLHFFAGGAVGGQSKRLGYVGSVSRSASQSS
jgi:hypothetical protein